MINWAKAPAPRHQMVLISQTLDELVEPNHPVRVLDAFFATLDWRLWEARYDRQRGHPPIHPRWMAALILYGLVKRIRSSRDLEEATRERLDFKWLLGGRTIDHTTIAIFRTRFEKELRQLNREISRALVLRAGGTALVELILDGTRIRANSERSGARSAAGLEKLIAACAEQLDLKLAQLAQGDAQNEELQALRQEIERVEAERDKYRAALEKAAERDEAKRKVDGAKAKPVRVPVTDPDSTILPNKEGGFAPNYTPTAAVEARSGAIISAGVVTGGDECQAVAKTVADCQEVLGKRPERLLADSNFASGKCLEELKEGGVESYMPVGGIDLSENNPANRPDPTVAVAEELRKNLPLHAKQLDAAAFLYDAQKEQYYCPMGKILTCRRTGRYKRTGTAYRAYACPGKEGCPLADQCVKGKAKRRTVARDQYQDSRDEVARRMAGATGQAIYRKRAPSIEGVFAVMKQSMGVRQFLMRSLEKVRVEWDWICGAYNLRKMLRMLTAPQSASRG